MKRLAIAAATLICRASWKLGDNSHPQTACLMGNLSLSSSFLLCLEQRYVVFDGVPLAGGFSTCAICISKAILDEMNKLI